MYTRVRRCAHLFSRLRLICSHERALRERERESTKKVLAKLIIDERDFVLFKFSLPFSLFLFWSFLETNATDFFLPLRR
jgi:hypothetical protein